MKKEFTPEERQQRAEYYAKRIARYLIVMILALIALLFLWLISKWTSEPKEEREPRRPQNYAFCPAPRGAFSLSAYKY